MSASKLAWFGSRCCTIASGTGNSRGRLPSSVVSAVRPPADAAIATSWYMRLLVRYHSGNMWPLDFQPTLLIGLRVRPAARANRPRFWLAAIVIDLAMSEVEDEHRTDEIEPPEQ